MHSENLKEKISARPVRIRELFPDCEIEPAWNIEQIVRVAPQYAMRLAIGAEVIENPRAMRDYVMLIFEGTEYVLPRENWNHVYRIYEDFMISYIKRNGYSNDPLEIRHKPNVILEGVRFMEVRARELQKFTPETPKIYWLIPDEWASGFYRARLPAQFAKDNCGFVVDAFTYCNYAHMATYDVFVYHRTPNAATTQVFQRLATEGRVVVYDCDDDVFNIPNWSIVHGRFTPDQFQKAMTARDGADYCFTTTETLRSSIGPKKTTVLPNLVVPSMFKEPVNRRSKRFQKKFMGFRPVREGDEVRLKHQKTGHYLRTDNIVIEEEYDPIIILWYGSNTHDDDVNQLVPVVREVGKKYGMAVRFCFFGYCPPDFINAVINPGNTNPTIEVKDEYKDYVDYVRPVEFRDFHQVMHAINPDIGLCPLVDHVFNRAKSNIKPLEFGCMRIPSICVDYGPYQCIKHGEDGLKVPINDTKAWIEAIETLIHDDELRISMGDKIYERVQDEFSWETDNPNRQKYEDFFRKIREEALARRGKRRKDFDPFFVPQETPWEVGES